MSVATDITALADELTDAYAGRRTDVVPPSSRDASFDLAAGYAVEAELSRRRRASGHQIVGRKVGFANKAMWRALKLDTLAWASMYDDTVRYAGDNTGTLAVGAMGSPKIEPEIVLGLGQGGLGESEPLAAVEWVALGFEIINCVYADWKFQPQDFVASFGLHAALLVGEPLRLTPDTRQRLVEQLASFKVTLARNGEQVAEGSGRNALRSPALCLVELAAAIARRPGAEPLRGGELVSTGTLTESQPIAVGEAWMAVVDGLELPPLTLRLV